MLWRTLTPLTAAAALLLGGAYSYAAEETVPGTALLAAGLITLGVWIGEAVRTDQDHEDEVP